MFFYLKLNVIAIAGATFPWCFVYWQKDNFAIVQLSFSTRLQKSCIHFLLHRYFRIKTVLWKTPIGSTYFFVQNESSAPRVRKKYMWISLLSLKIIQFFLEDDFQSFPKYINPKILRGFLEFQQIKIILNKRS